MFANIANADNDTRFAVSGSLDRLADAVAKSAAELHKSARMYRTTDDNEERRLDDPAFGKLVDDVLAGRRGLRDAVARPLFNQAQREAGRLLRSRRRLLPDGHAGASVIYQSS